MFVINNDKTRFPIKTWLSGMEKLEESCLEQAYHLSQLPFLHKWVCLMPAMVLIIIIYTAKNTEWKNT